MAVTKLDATEQLLADLTNSDGVPGYEDGPRKVMARYLKPLADSVDYDRLGSIIGVKKGSSDAPKVLVAGHLDEIGFMVKEITKDGYIKFLPLGGWWGHVALAQRLKILTSKGPVLGVVGSRPPHLLPPEERKKTLEIKDMFVDVGAMSGYDVEKKLGIRIGDPIVPDSQFTKMSNDKLYMAKAFDNRAACAVVVELFKKLKRSAHPNTVYGAGTVQEEVGCRGAQTVANTVMPDVGIICDTGIAQDVPPDTHNKAERLDGGAAILCYDATMIPSIKLRDIAIEIAKKNKIPFHLTTMERGGTDGGKVHVSGIGAPSLVIGPPVRYIHSHNSIMYRKDFDNVVKLIFEIVRKLDKKTVQGLGPRG